MQALCSLFPLKKEHLSVLTRSWDDGNCHNGDRQSVLVTAVGLGTSTHTRVDACFTVGIDLSLVVVEDDRTC
jgi:hypothetical protein